MLLNSKTLKLDKERRFKEQNGLCCICKRELNSDIQSNHLDHDHSLEGANAGKVRGLLCNLCNSLEGQIKHKFERSGLKSKDIDMYQWMKDMVVYWEKDTSESDLHPKYLPDMVKKFARLNKSDMIDVMKSMNFSTDNLYSKADFVKSYRKELRNFLK